MMMLLIGMKISLTKKPMKPMIVNPIIVCKQIFLYSAQSRSGGRGGGEGGGRRIVSEKTAQETETCANGGGRRCGVVFGCVCVGGGEDPRDLARPPHTALAIIDPFRASGWDLPRVWWCPEGPAEASRSRSPPTPPDHQHFTWGAPPPTFTRGFLTYLWRQAWCTSSPASTSSWRSP